ncbi:MAG: hypothetical protein H6666_17765 [Ardenticatenaceae bacterium]|nr:hypothetical protein [Ardenticatenaceae bacterium]
MLNQTVFARLANLLAALALVLLLAGPFGPGQGTDGDCVDIPAGNACTLVIDQ